MQVRFLPTEVWGLELGRPGITSRREIPTTIGEHRMTIRSENGIQLESTGRIIYANRGIIGVDPNGDVFGGYDDEVWAAGIQKEWDEDDPPFTREERIELADYMIGLWTAYKERDAAG